MKEPFFDDSRFKLVMAGERAGKSFTGGTYAGARFMHRYLVEPERSQLIWLVGKDYEACKPEFDYLSEQMVQFGLVDIRGIHIRDDGRDKCSFATLDGRLFVETITGADPQKVARMSPDGILGCEVAQWDEELFLRCIGRLAERRGWLWASGSWEGSLGWLPTLWRRWRAPNDEQGRSWAVASWTNRVIFPKGEQDEEIIRQRAMRSPGKFRERFGGEPDTPAGAVYADDLTPDRITYEAQYDPELPVQLWVDPGYGQGYAVLVVQFKGKYLDLIDEIYLRELTNDQVTGIARERKWWKHGLYVVIDRGGQQHHAEQSAVEAWRKVGARLSWRKVAINDGIDRVKSFLRCRDTSILPFMRINPACVGLIAEMGHGPGPYPDIRPYSYKVDANGLAVRELPVSEYNHSCSALAYGLVDNFGLVGDRNKEARVGTYIMRGGNSYFDWGRAPGSIEDAAKRLSTNAMRDVIDRS